MRALLRKGIDEDIAEEVLRKFDRAGLIDDASFAENWVHSRHSYQGLGRRALGFELRRKGVEESIVDEALSTVDDETEVQRARELVRRRIRSSVSASGSSDGASDTKLVRRLMGMLARKGYSEALAYRVVREELERADLDRSELDGPAS